MASWRTRGIVLFAAGIGVLIALFATVPGEHRLLCPACFGMQEIGDRVFVEATKAASDAPRVLSILRRARRRVRDFYGPLQARPVIVVCRTASCATSFGGGAANAVAYGWRAIRLAPSGLTTVVVAHELSHVELHWRIGLRGMIETVVPVWFDEGLAVLVSGDRRLGRRVPRAAAEDIVAHRTLRQWSAHTRAVGWRAAYGAAAAAVRQIERRIGRDGLRRMVDRLSEGHSFDAVANGCHSD